MDFSIDVWGNFTCRGVPEGIFIHFRKFLRSLYMSYVAIYSLGHSHGRMACNSYENYNTAPN